MNYRLRERGEGGYGEDPSYPQVVDEMLDSSLDFALVDGIYRDYCAVDVVDKIKPGGVLIIDNVNHYLPSDSFAPNSRSYKQGPISGLWGKFLEIIKDWRCIWTSNGVSDTAFYYKPGERVDQV